MCYHGPSTHDGRELRRYRHRWKVERLFAWLLRFRRIVTVRQACSEGRVVLRHVDLTTHRSDRGKFVDSTLIAVWNVCVGLKPSLAEVRRLLEPRILIPVAPGAVDFLITLDGFFVKLPPGKGSGSVQAVGLCVDREYFLAPGPQPEPIRGELVLNGVALAGSAVAVLGRFRAAGLTPVELMSDGELFTMIYGNSVNLEFLAGNHRSSGADDSSFAAVQFNFGPTYTGRVPPVIEARAASDARADRLHHRRGVVSDFWIAPGEGATDEQLDHAESTIGRVLPPALRRLLKIKNGGVSTYAAFVDRERYFPLLPLLGVDPRASTGSLTGAYAVRRDFAVPDDVIVFAAQGSALLGLCYPGASCVPSVVYRDDVDGDLETVAATFQDFLDGLVEG
jgi:hypothetical protein